MQLGPVFATWRHSWAITSHMIRAICNNPPPGPRVIGNGLVNAKPRGAARLPYGLASRQYLPSSTVLREANRGKGVQESMRPWFELFPAPCFGIVEYHGLVQLGISCQ